MNFANFKPRIWFFLGFAGSMSLLAIGAYLQFVEQLEPCPLCISQRIGIFVTGLIMLAAGIHNPGLIGRRVYAIVGGISALIGGSISIRHIWLQHLPPEEVPECSPGLEYVFQHFPLTDTLKLMLSGTGECAKVDWTLLGFSIPQLTLVAFLGLAIVCLAQWFNGDVDKYI